MEEIYASFLFQSINRHEIFLWVFFVRIIFKIFVRHIKSYCFIIISATEKYCHKVRGEKRSVSICGQPEKA